MHRPWAYLVVSVACIAALVGYLVVSRDGGGFGDAMQALQPHDAEVPAKAEKNPETAVPEAAGAPPLLLYCAAGIKAPVQAVVDEYRDTSGAIVRVQYGGSGTLLSQLRVAKQGDLYLAGDSSYIDLAREQGLVAESIPVAYLRPVIAVPKGNPKGIASIADLLAEEVRTSLGLPEAASVGRQSKELLSKIGLWERIGAAVENRGVFKPTVNEVAIDVEIGAVDAGIVWDATVAQFPELEAVPIREAKDFVLTVSVGVLRSCERPAAALRFARYLTARDRGLPIFAEHGFRPVEGDTWAATPEVLYFSGGVNRVAIEKTLDAFQRREGCRVLTSYNGCGILVGQMKLGERPDIYHSCDISFMRDITELFDPAVNVSETDMVIATPKGNPKGIQSLEDLAKDGMEIGLANEEQSALGALTARLLEANGLYERVVRNAISRTPTADLLVNQVRTGSLDAVVVYRANTAVSASELEVISLEVPEAIAIQTYAIGKNSGHKQLAGRLLEAIGSAKSQQRYQEAGFRWLVP